MKTPRTPNYTNLSSTELLRTRTAEPGREMSICSRMGGEIERRWPLKSKEHR